MSKAKTKEECMTIEECLRLLNEFVTTAKALCAKELCDKIAGAEEALINLPKLIQELKDLSKIGDIYGECEDSHTKVYGSR